MKKFFSLALIFVLSLSVYSTFEIKAAATEDVTINFHIHQFDGEYTNTGLGIWDGVTWNSFADVQTSTDEFGAIITKTWTAAQVNDAAFLADMQVKPSSNGDNADNYLAPASIGGQPTLDVSSLIDGSKTVLDVYYVEGATSFYTNTTGNALFMNVFVNPGVAADAAIYTDWGMHVWNNGPGGSSATWDEPIAFEIDMEIQVGDYLVPMKLGVLEVGAGATVESGFIVHKGDEKSFDENIYFDGASLLGVVDDPETTEVDESTPNKAEVVFYEFGMGEFTADYSTFVTNVTASYKENLKNKFMSASITTPESLDVAMLTPKSIFDLELGRFSVTDSSGNDVAILGLDFGTTPAFTAVDTDVVIEFQSYVRVYVETDYDHTMIGMVGSFNSWDATSPVMSVGDHLGYAVFEVSTNVANFDYVFLYNDGVDDTETADVDESGFTWGDIKFSGDNNLSTVLEPGDSYTSLFVDETDTLYIDAFTSVDAADYTYTTSAVCTEGQKMLTVFVETDMPTTDLTVFGLVGTPQQSGWDATLNDGDGGWTNGGWNPSAAINPIGVDANGYLVFEVCVEIAGDNPLHQEFKVLYNDGVDNTETADSDESGFNWGDTEITNQVVFDFVDEADSSMAIFSSNEIFATDLASYVATIEVTNTYRYTLYLNPGELDITDFAVVGQLQETAWDITAPLMFTMQDYAGNYYMDFGIHNKDAEFIILYNSMDDDAATTEVDESVFTWDHKISGNDNLKTGLGEESFKAEMVTYTMVEEVMTFAVASLMDHTTTTMTLEFADDSLMYGTDYTVSYVEAYGDEDTVISMENLEFAVSNNFVEGDEIAATGTYALLPTEISVIFVNPLLVATDLTVELLDSEGTVIAIESMEPVYTMGTYTPTLTTCPAGSEMLTVYLQTTQDTSDLTMFGLVGTPQNTIWDATANDGAGGYTGGWNTDAAINPTGLDSNGNLVFEVCVLTSGADATADTDDDTTHNEFKVLYNDGIDNPDTDDDEAIFTWSDVELTAQVMFDFDGPEVMMVQEGLGANEITRFTYTLSAANKLIGSGDYELRFTDANGFVIEYGVIVDNVAPVIDATQSADALEVNNDATEFDLMDYFSILRFVDNQDGAIAYTIERTVNLDVVGARNVIISATDIWGNRATHTFLFTVIDVIDPVITLSANPTFEAGAVEPDWNDYVTVDGGTVVVNSTQVDMANAGTFYVVFTATDAANNTATQNLEVTITAVEVEPDTGCFGSVGVGATLVALLSLIGTAAFVVIRKR